MMSATAIGFGREGFGINCKRGLAGGFCCGSSKIDFFRVNIKPALMAFWNFDSFGGGEGGLGGGISEIPEGSLLTIGLLGLAISMLETFDFGMFNITGARSDPD